jgi:hypothetical protein
MTESSYQKRKIKNEMQIRVLILSAGCQGGIPFIYIVGEDHLLSPKMKKVGPIFTGVEG